MVSKDFTIGYKELRKVAIAALRPSGVSQDHAEVTVDILLRADLRGYSSHGVQRLPVYIKRIQKGLINPIPNLSVDSPTSNIRLVNGDHGLGPVVAERGMKEAILAAKAHGLACAGCKQSNHFGSAAPYVLVACEERMIGIAATNALPTMAPWGGLEKLVGNNPLAIGVPIEGDAPFVLDMAMSVSSRGRMREMAEKGEKISDGWAVDLTGRPTTDPLDGLKGFVLPIGMHKGYGLAVAIDILCGVLTGSGFSDGIKSLFQQWEEPQHIGHFFIALDPVRFMPWETFSNRMRSLAKILRNANRINPEVSVRLPGETEDQLEKDRLKKGIPLEKNIWEALQSLAYGSHDYEPPKI